jgi:hypothetical protein
MTKPLPTPEEIQAGIDNYNKELRAIEEAGFYCRGTSMYGKVGCQAVFWFDPSYSAPKRPWELFFNDMKPRRYATVFSLLKAAQKLHEEYGG